MTYCGDKGLDSNTKMRIKGWRKIRMDDGRNYVFYYKMDKITM